MHKERNLTAIGKRLCSSLHGEIQLKLFAGEAASNSTQLKDTAVAEMVSLKEASIDISASTKQKKGGGGGR